MSEQAKWDYEVDFLSVGTGAAGISAAITAAKNGLDTLLVESRDKWGGTTAKSGGGLWMPNNPYMAELGIEDSFESAYEYMRQTIGEPGVWASDDRKRAFLGGVHHYIQMLENEGVKWVAAEAYPDYYPDLPGGRAGGRSIEVKPFNLRKLPKAARKTMQPAAMPAPLLNGEVYQLTRAWSSPDGFVRGARFVFRTLGAIITGQKKVGMGGALAASLMWVALRNGVELWLSSPIKELIVEGGRVTGAVVEKEGKLVRIGVRRGVMLGAGGFSHNKEWRQKYHGVEGWSSAPDGQNGEGITVGEQAGGAIAMMDDAWWGATTADPDSKGNYGFILNERSDPWSIIVDQNGERYFNESESYVDVGHHILEHDKKTGGKAIHSWLVLDRRHSTHFLNSALMIPGARKKLLKNGELVEARTIDELAEKMNVDKQAFAATVERFNEFARNGVDKDFQRGRTAYDNYYGYPSLKNPNLGTIEKGPFKAMKIYPGDLGTKGGLVTDEWARVLRPDGSVVEGLYAAGNNTASVMGRTYPGAGSTIGPAGVFGYLGALHAAQPEERKAVISQS